MNVENATELSVKVNSEEFCQTFKHQRSQDIETEEYPESIYDDICDFDLGEKIEQGNARIRELDEENKSLKQEVQSLKDAILVQKKIETTLTKNISSLFLTAKAEIARKDRQIAQLTEKLDNMYFRRKSSTWKPDDNIRKATDCDKTESAKITNPEVVANGPPFDIKKGDKEVRTNEAVVVDLSYVPHKNENVFQNVNLEDKNRQSASLETRSSNKSVQDLREQLKEEESDQQHNKYSIKENVYCEDENRMLDYRSNDGRDLFRQDRRYREAYGKDRFGDVQYWMEDFNRRGRYDLDNRNRKKFYGERDRYYDGRRRDRRNTYGDRENRWRNTYYDNDLRTYDERERYRRHYHEEQNSYNYDDERNRRYRDGNVERNDYGDVQTIQGESERGMLRRDEKMNAEPADTKEDFGMPRYQEDSVTHDGHQIERLREMRGYRNQEYDLCNDAAQRDPRRRGRSVERSRARSRSRETYRRENGRRTKSVGPSRSSHMKESNHDKRDEFNTDSKINRAGRNSFERVSQIVKCNSEEQKVSSTTDKEILVRAEEGNQRRPNASNEASLLPNLHVIETNVSKNLASLKTDQLHKHSDSSNNLKAESAETHLKQDPKSRRKKLKMLTKVENDYRKKLMPPSESCMDDTLLTTWDNAESTCLNSWTEVSSQSILQLDKTAKQAQNKLPSISIQIKTEETSTTHVCDSKKIEIGKLHEQVNTVFSERQKLLLANKNNRCTIIETNEGNSTKTEKSLSEKEQSVTDCNKPTENNIDPNKEGINNRIVHEEKSENANERIANASKIIENLEQPKTVPNQKYEANNNKKELKIRSSKSETYIQGKKDIKEDAENLSAKNICNYRIPKTKTSQAAIPQAKSENHIATKVDMTRTIEHKTVRAESSKIKSPKTPKKTRRSRVIDSDSDELEEASSSFLHEQKSKPKEVVKSKIAPSLPTLSEADANKQRNDKKKPIPSGTVNDSYIYPDEDTLNVDFHSQKNEENREGDIKKTIIVLSNIKISKDNTEVVLQNVEAIKEIKNSIEKTGIVECPDTSLNEKNQDTNKEKILKTEIDKELRGKPTNRKRSKSTEIKTINEIKTKTVNANKDPTIHDKSVENIKTDNLPNLNSISKKEAVKEIIDNVSRDKKSRNDCNKQKELQNKPAKSIKGAESDCKVHDSAKESRTAEVINTDFNMPQNATETVNDMSKELEDNLAKRRKSNKPVKKIKTAGLPNLDILNNETAKDVHQVEDLSINVSMVAELTTRIRKVNETDDTKKGIDVVKDITKDNKSRMDCSKQKELHDKPIKQTISKSMDSATKDADISGKRDCDSECNTKTKTNDELTTTEVIKTDINILQKATETVDDRSRKKEPRNELNSKPTKRKSNSTENKTKEASICRKKESCDVENTYKLRTRTTSENKEFTEGNKTVKRIKTTGLPNLDISSNESEKEAVEKHCEKLSTNINSVSGLAAVKTVETKTNEIDVTVDKITELVNITTIPKGVKRKRISDSAATVQNDLSETVTKKPKEAIKIEASQVNNTSSEGTKKRITNLIPVKASSLYSFENILVKNQLPSFTERLSEQMSVQLTDEGEIPLLHLDENHLNNLPQEDISKNNDLLKLLDNMSTIEPDALKFKSTSEDSKQSLGSLKDYTFENFMSKASSTPIVNNSSQKISNNTVSKEIVSGDAKIVSSEQQQQQGLLSNNIYHNLDVNNSTKPLMSHVGRRRRCRLVRVE